MGNGATGAPILPPLPEDAQRLLIVRRAARLAVALVVHRVVEHVGRALLALAAVRRFLFARALFGPPGVPRPAGPGAIRFSHPPPTFSLFGSTPVRALTALQNAAPPPPQ